MDSDSESAALPQPVPAEILPVTVASTPPTPPSATTTTPASPSTAPLDSSSSPLQPASSSSVPGPIPPKPLAAPEVLVRVIGEPMRWKILRELANGSRPAVMDLAKRLGCHPDQMGRHLRRLSRAGLIRRIKVEDGDGRSRYYQIHPAYRRTLSDGRQELDYGVVALRFEPK